MALIANDQKNVVNKEPVKNMINSIRSSTDKIKRNISEYISELDEIYQDLEQSKLDPPSLLALSDRDKKLPWPVNGVIQYNYGDTRTNDERWKGLFIKTEPEDVVRAFQAGRVVFSDRLKGLGLLMIIEHKDGYMSLYAHNSTLLKQQNDWVQAGDLIATTGFTPNGYGLYFEIRRNGQPVNPKRWLIRG